MQFTSIILLYHVIAGNLEDDWFLFLLNVFSYVLHALTHRLNCTRSLSSFLNLLSNIYRWFRTPSSSWIVLSILYSLFGTQFASTAPS